MTYLKNQILQDNDLSLPFWGKIDRWEYAKLQFDRQPFSDFTYRNIVTNN